MPVCLRLRTYILRKDMMIQHGGKVGPTLKRSSRARARFSVPLEGLPKSDRVAPEHTPFSLRVHVLNSNGRDG